MDTLSLAVASRRFYAQDLAHEKQDALVDAVALSLELACALDAARAGGHAAMQHYGNVSPVLKESGSPVTAADHASTAAILSLIATRFPDDAILCEETADVATRMDATRVWIIDPLDGTKEFIQQNGEFSVMIGLVEHGTPIAGAVYVPASDVMYFADRGCGAWEDRGGLVTRLSRQSASRMRTVVSRSHTDATVQRICDELHVTERRPSGSVGIKCALIATDDADLYVHPVPYMGEWDTCAPEIILREAGGTVTDCLGAPLQYNKADTRQPFGILACAPGLLQHVLPVISRIYSSAHPV